MFPIHAFKRLLPTLAVVLAACTAHGAQTVGQLIDQSAIAVKTKAALLDNKSDVGANVNVEVHKGIVQLSGLVEFRAGEIAALATAGKVGDTKKVLDAIGVIEGSPSMGETVDHTTIQTKLKAGLAKAEGPGDAFAINTEARHGRVLLAGFSARHDADNTQETWPRASAAQSRCTISSACSREYTPNGSEINTGEMHEDHINQIASFLRRAVPRAAGRLCLQPG